MHKANIILIGFMGTGKTSVGRHLAERLNWRFVDSDNEIEKTTGMPIPDYFRLFGEVAFRKQEHEVLTGLLSRTHQIIATGGGAVLNENNRQAMLDGGFVVQLHAEADTIISRVEGNENRPLLSGDPRERVMSLLRERHQAYDFAHVRIQTDRRSVESLSGLILKKWKNRSGR